MSSVAGADYWRERPNESGCWLLCLYHGSLFEDSLCLLIGKGIFKQRLINSVVDRTAGTPLFRKWLAMHYGALIFPVGRSRINALVAEYAELCFKRMGRGPCCQFGDEWIEKHLVKYRVEAVAWKQKLVEDSLVAEDRDDDDH